MAEKEKTGAGGADQQQQQAGADAARQERRGPDARFTRPPQTQAGFETRAVCGYDRAGNARTFNLLAKEELPDGWSDAPPEGRHPNEPPRAA